MLHTRTTAPRASRNARRGSRHIFLTMCGAVMLAALAACGSDNSTAPPTLATITVTPSNPTIAAGGTQQFTAVGKDGNGNVVPIDPTWSLASVDGTISGDGLFTAGSTTGTFANAISAKVGNVTGSASVTITPATPDVTGDYTLQTVDGKAPPDTIVHTDSATIVFTDGALSLHSDDTYKLLFHTLTTTGASTVADSSGTVGTYAVDGNTVTLHSSPTDSAVATVSGTSLSFTAGGELFVFSK